MTKTRTDALRSAILGLLVIALVGIGYSRLKSSKTPPARKGVSAVPIVETTSVHNRTRSIDIPISGRLAAERRIELFSEVQGVMLDNQQRFKTGRAFRKGELLVSIDDAEVQAALIAQRSAFIQNIAQLLPDLSLDHPEDASQWKAYLNQLRPERDPPPLPEPGSETLRLFLTARNVYSNYHNLKSASTRAAKYRIVAPFDGILVDAQLTEGSLVRPGQRLGSFIAPGRYELEGSVSSTQMDWVRVGTALTLNSEEGKGRWRGTVVRVNNRIDEATQSVRVFIRVEGSDLQEGQYLHGSPGTRSFEDVFAYPRLSLVQDRFVYAVRDSVLERRAVKIVASGKDSVLIRGLEEGLPVLTKPLPGAYDGLKVKPLSTARP
ncbi:HlyD family efflux transporter periplasmic adaptor subunit [bacterium]|nr:HlyD family efflux transporter periplasmic adaptor subunit [bacterium]